MAIRSLFPTIVSNASTSFVSLVITVVVGRQEGVFELGVFGVGFAVLGLTQLVTREAGVNTAWASRASAARPEAFFRVCLVALTVSLTLSAIGVGMGSTTLSLTGASILGFCVYDFARLWEISAARRAGVIVTDGILSVVMISVAVLIVINDLSSAWLLGTWSILLFGLTLCHALRWKPVWSRRGLTDRDGWVFGPQALLGAGSTHVATTILAVAASALLIGEIRAASTLFGIVNVISVTLQSVVIQALAQARNRRRTLSRWFCLSMAVQGVMAGAAAWISVLAGPLLFGDAWGASSRLVPWLALDVVLVALGVCAVAAHKVDRMAKSATVAALSGGVLRISLAPLAGYFGDALTVVIIFCLISALSSVVWWFSYIRYRRVMPES